MADKPTARLPALYNVDMRIGKDLWPGEYVNRWWCDKPFCCPKPGDPAECGHVGFDKVSLPDPGVLVAAVGTNHYRVCVFSRLAREYVWCNTARRL